MSLAMHKYYNNTNNNNNNKNNKNIDKYTYSYVFRRFYFPHVNISVIFKREVLTTPRPTTISIEY